MFQTIVFTLLFANACWWFFLDRRLRTMPNTFAWRVGLATFLAGAAVLPIVAVRVAHVFPTVFPAVGFLWFLLFLPPLMIGLAVRWLFRAAFGRRRRASPLAQFVNPAEPTTPSHAIAAATVSRRRMVTVLAAAVPPVLCGGVAAFGADEIRHFRIRSIDLPVVGLPPDLAGMTIAHVSDLHVGPFTTEKMLRDVVDRTNSIHEGGPADLVLFTGDLINTTLRDLPAGVDVCRAFRSRLGTFLCQGNHDVMQSPAGFARGVERAGLPLLIDETLTIQATPRTRLQLLAPGWKAVEADLMQKVTQLAAQRDPGAFPLMMAHHPHGWDAAARCGLPLVFSGHTHGGQIMLTDRIGAGPLKFRYWTGIHTRAGSTLVVNNGVGNWFPLRINAPAEILKLTLHPAAV